MTTCKYDKRIIAYVDVIGWKEACNEACSEEKVYTRVRAVAEEIARLARSFSTETKQFLRGAPGVSDAFINEHGSIEFSFFSDNFAISTTVDNGELLFRFLASVCHDFLLKEFLVRGGVTIGELFHGQGMIFGPAMVEAVELEQKAKYPRILCSSDLGVFLEETDYKNKVVMTDCDQDLIVNIALSTLFARDDLLSIINNRITETKKYDQKCKWQYLVIMIKRMYLARNIT